MNRRELLGAATAGVVGLMFGWPELVWAEDKVGPPVTITKKDRTTVRGKIVSHDRDKVTIAAITKPKMPTQEVDVPWSDIDRISNGLTYKKALQEWKGFHHDSLCVGCHGDGTTFCPTCHGTFHDPAASVGCPTCKGAAQVVCTTPRCNHGTIPCPNPNCLKLTDGGWTKQADGLHWKKFPNANGYNTWSERHLGQVVQKVGGEWQNLGTCSVCGGLTTIGDPVCKATGQMPCPKCSKNTKSPPCPNKCDQGVVLCTTCKGTGLKV